MYQHRPSILRRPITANSGANETSAERQYEQEQDKLRAKALKSADTQDRLMRALYPMPEDKAAAAADVQQHMETVLAAKLMSQHESSLKGGHYSTGPGVAQVLVVAEDKPWLNPSLVYRNAVEEKQARRGHEEEVASVNRQMMIAASLRRTMAEQREQEDARAALNSQNFWNVGSRPGDRCNPVHHRPESNTTKAVVTTPWAQDSLPPAGRASGGGAGESTMSIGYGYTDSYAHGGGYGNGCDTAAVSAANAAVVASAGRYNAAGNSSSAMEQLLQQNPAQKMAAPIVEREVVAYPQHHVSAPYANAGNNAAHAPAAPPAAYQAHQQQIIGAPFATADNNAAHAPAAAAVPAYATHNASAPFATAGNNATHAPPPPPAAYPSHYQQATVPYATITADSAPMAAQQAMGARYASRPASAQGRSVTPWATNDELPASPVSAAPRPARAPSCTDFAPTFTPPHTGRAQGPVGTMSQILGSGALGPAPRLHPTTPSGRAQGPVSTMSQILGSGALNGAAAGSRQLYPATPSGRYQGPVGSMSQILGSGALNASSSGSVRWESKQQAKAFPWLN